MTMNDPSVPKGNLVYKQKITLSLANVNCAKVHQMYQNSLGMMLRVLNTDPILSIPKCNWCTKSNECTYCTHNDQERS